MRNHIALAASLVLGSGTALAAPPRIVVDAGHGNAHTIDGRYRAFAEELRAGGAVVESATSLPADLAGVDLLVIAGARGPREDSTRSAFTAEELVTVRAYVEAGGALLLVTDHPPIAHAMQPLLAQFGVDGGLGEVWDEAHKAEGMDASNIVYERPRLGRHPILDGVTRVMTFTGQSLSVPGNATPLLLLGETAVDVHPKLISVEGTRRRYELGDPTPAKGRAQALALTAGKGRVVITGEAAMLTAQVENGRPFGMNVTGVDNRRFLHNLVGWLVRKERRP